MKICFLSLGSYSLLTDSNLGYIGGAEVEQVNLAKYLVSKGYDVSFVTYFHGKNKIEYVDGIEIIKTYERERIENINELSKYMQIWMALKKANADIYFHAAGSPGILPLFCRRYNKKYIYRISSDSEVTNSTIWGYHGNIMKYIQKLEIKMASLIISQNKYQKKLLKENYDVESIIIKNPIYIPKIDYNKSEPPIVLWVGTIKSLKNPHLFIELARSINNANFVMIGGNTKNTELYDYIHDSARKILNLTFYGFVPHHEIGEFYKNASILVNTSIYEGFPQTFIEAWMHYVPVVSINVDPDGIITERKLGFCSGSMENLISNIKYLLTEEELRKEMGINARKYVENENDVKLIANKYMRVFNKIYESY